MDERKLIREAQSGNVRSFNELVRTYQELAYRTAFRVLGEREAAADATQEAFLAAYTHIRSLRGDSFKSWLLRIVTNACYNLLRSKYRRRTVSLDGLAVEPEQAMPLFPAHSEVDPQEFAERQELGRLIQEGLLTLPADQRIVLILSDMENLSHAEIEQITGVNQGTIKSRLSRARSRMRDVLQSQGVTPDASARRRLEPSDRDVMPGPRARLYPAQSLLAFKSPAAAPAPL